MAFSDVSLFTYMNQTDTPLASTRGHLMDHFPLRVTDLEAWAAKLRPENVRFLEQPYVVGDYRAVLAADSDLPDRRRHGSRQRQ